jgi:hypothetical protein
VTITYPCPRTDLGCTAAFLSAGDLDYHFHLAHGYRALYRIRVSLRPPKPIGPAPARHVPDGLVAGPGTPTLGERRAERDSRELADAERPAGTGRSPALR